MIPRFFLSRVARQAKDMSKHVVKILNHQRDLLSPQAIEAVSVAVENVQAAFKAREQNDVLQKKMANLETVANKWLKSYPHAGFRENVEVFLVAVAVAMGVRTFFLQPFKIPTGSMQPTLYGITHQDLRYDPSAMIPSGFARFYDSWVRGISYYREVADADGRLEIKDKVPQRVVPFVTRQKFSVGGREHTVWFPPDQLFGPDGNGGRSGLAEGQFFHAGEDILKLKVVNGDHLFVDRMSYNFRRPTRGEIIVFETKGIQDLPQDQFYIKRLVALGGERVRIGNDRHLIINGNRLDASTPHFEKVYSFHGPPRESQYSGHVNGFVAKENGRDRISLARHFPEELSEFHVAENHYMVMGDNTMNSYDSRSWGDFPQTNVIGKSFLVYWPFVRFGWWHR
jgi:signal peptidase I